MFYTKCIKADITFVNFGYFVSCGESSFLLLASVRWYDEPGEKHNQGRQSQKRP